MGRARRKVDHREVDRELPDDISPALLKALHILTRDGDLNADSRRKLKQVTHLLGLVAPAVEDVLGRVADPVFVDFGAGKGYLGFLLASRFLAKAGRGRVINVESRAELCDRAREVAREASLGSVEFVAGEADVVALPARVHLVTALHACDTATDDALAAAIMHGADHVAVVPCCQAEVARQLKDAPRRDGALGELHAHPIHRREFGAHLTNVIRALVLEACGYGVTVTELVGWEHSLKNELILGRRVERDQRGPRERLGRLLVDTGVRPKLVRTLAERGVLRLEDGVAGE